MTENGGVPLLKKMGMQVVHGQVIFTPNVGEANASMDAATTTPPPSSDRIP